jgi:hypothetical protein
MSRKTSWLGYKLYISIGKARLRTACQEEGRCPKVRGLLLVNEAPCLPALVLSWAIREVFLAIFDRH